MTKLVLETDDAWTKQKIEGAIHTEIELLKKVVQKTKTKVESFEGRYGRFDRNFLYGNVDDMVLIEWEGEIETLKRLKKKLKSLEDIIFEYK